MLSPSLCCASQAKGKSRLQQIVDWLGGADFEGVLVFDEVSQWRSGRGDL
jgi:hypothetical protein